MKSQIKFKDQSIATKYVEDLKKERDIDATCENQEDGSILVEYSLASCCSSKEENITYSTLQSFYRSIMDETNYRLKWIDERIDYLSKRLYEHEEGHLPKIKGAGKLEEVLKVLGLDEEYEIVKPKIYIEASRGGRASSFLVDLDA